MFGGGEVIADALVSGTPWTDVGVGLGVGVGVYVGSGSAVPSPQAAITAASAEDKSSNLASFRFMDATP